MKILAALLLAALAFPDTAVAQSESRRFVWAGAGYGSFGCWESFRCDFRESMEARGAHSAFGGAAWTVSRFAQLGAELGWRHKDKGGATIDQYAANVLLFLRPPVLNRLAVRGGAGIASRRQSGTEGDILLNTIQGGTLVSAGVSYDIRLSSRVSFTPALDLGAANYGSWNHAKMWESRVALTWR
jgi:hypothetical protein